MLLGDFDAHEAEVEHFVEQILAEDGGVIHGADMGGDAFTGELADGSLEHFFVEREKRQGKRGMWGGFGCGGHRFSV